MKQHRLSIIPGDGVGKEVVPEGLKAIRAAADVTGSFGIETVDYPWSCEYYATNGRMMDDDAMDRMRDSDAIFLGAIGFPGVPDHVSLWTMLLPIRQAFDLYINLRPTKLLPGIPGPLRDRTPADIDFVTIRENTEGEYCGVGGRIRPGTPDEVVTQTAFFTRKGTERVVRYAFDLAMKRKKQLVSCTKSNALNYSMVFWDEIVALVGKEYPEVSVQNQHVDALSARFVLNPQQLDVIVASNLFGDILTDIGGALMGSLGLPASGNIDPSGKHPSLFEPVHGSAPGRAGKALANPLATVIAASMMLEHLGEHDAARLVYQGVEHVALNGPKTIDLGGEAKTHEVGDAIAAWIHAQK
jgi:tartrate dehydrogenase/decarboxylase/D-malate dehydrogenase